MTTWRVTGCRRSLGKGAWLIAILGAAGCGTDAGEWRRIDLTNYGYVEVDSLQSGDPGSVTWQTRAWADFLRFPAGASISYRQLDDCREYRINRPQAPGDRAWAGTIAITGGGFPWSLEPRSQGYSSSSDQPFFQGGSITVEARGGEVPAFTASAVAPGSFDLLSPQLGKDRFDRLEDMTFRWSGDGAGVVRVTIADGIVQDRFDHAVECTFSNSAGHGTIPSHVLQSVFAANSDATLIVESGGANVDEYTQAGDFTVIVALYGDSSWSGQPRTSQLFRFWH